MAVTIETAASSQDLTLLATLKTELGITGTGEDTRLTALITRVSDEIARYCGRVFGKEEITETLPGVLAFRLVLSRTPLVSVTTVSNDGTALAAADWAIEDREIGFLWRDVGWGSNIPLATGTIARTRSRQLGERVWQVLYHAGYYLPGFANLTGSISGATSANPVVITTSAAHGLATGDRVRITAVGGMVELNGRDFAITVPSTTTYSLNSEDGTSHTTYTTGGTWTVFPQLPVDLEQIAIDLVASRRAGQARDSSVVSERLGDWSATYGTGSSGMPESIEARLLRYVRI